jgi:hypothetical protein
VLTKADRYRLACIIRILNQPELVIDKDTVLWLASKLTDVDEELKTATYKLQQLKLLDRDERRNAK